MSDVTATDAARRFSELLDAVEHEGRRFTVTRHGKPIAHIQPAAPGRGAEAKALLRRHTPDARWRADLDEVRGLLEVETRP